MVDSFWNLWEYTMGKAFIGVLIASPLMIVDVWLKNAKMQRDIDEILETQMKMIDDCNKKDAKNNS